MGGEQRKADAGQAVDAERAWRQAQVDAALEPYRGKLGAEDFEWMRERLLAALTDDPAAHELARAAFPREVDQSGEVLIAPGPKARRG